MNSLDIVQKLAKIGKILSKITYICAMIGACACLMGALLLPIGAGELLKIGGVSIHSILSRNIGIPQSCMALAGATIICAGQVVLAKSSYAYFARELEAGTPFTHAGAKELQKLGILNICVPLACAIPAAILKGFAEQAANTKWNVSTDIDGSITLGIVFVVVSLLCRCGAELLDKE